MKKDPKPTRAGVLHAVTEEILARKDGQIPTNIDGLDTFFHGPEASRTPCCFVGTRT